MRKNMKIILNLLAILCLSISCYGQKSNNVESRNCENSRQNSSRPSAFISFEKTGTQNAKESIWLRFNNNTKWNIYVRTTGFDKETDEYGVSYEVKILPDWKDKIKENDVPFGRQIAHVGSVRTIESGKSLLFNVPKSHLAEGLYITVDFSYEWELTGFGGGGGLEISHRAAFFSWQLTSQKQN
jgi:hypothetical protein